MELVYQNRLAYFLGSRDAEVDGNRWFYFTFRDIAGEKFEIRLRQADVPNGFFACNEIALERALQDILDRYADSPALVCS